MDWDVIEAALVWMTLLADDGDAFVELGTVDDGATVLNSRCELCMSWLWILEGNGEVEVIEVEEICPVLETTVWFLGDTQFDGTFDAADPMECEQNAKVEVDAPNFSLPTVDCVIGEGSNCLGTSSTVDAGANVAETSLGSVVASSPDASANVKWLTSIVVEIVVAIEC